MAGDISFTSLGQEPFDVPNPKEMTSPSTAPPTPTPRRKPNYCLIYRIRVHRLLSPPPPQCHYVFIKRRRSRRSASEQGFLVHFPQGTHTSLSNAHQNDKHSQAISPAGVASLHRTDTESSIVYRIVFRRPFLLDCASIHLVNNVTGRILRLLD